VELRLDLGASLTPLPNSSHIQPKPGLLEDMAAASGTHITSLFFHRQSPFLGFVPFSSHWPWGVGAVKTSVLPVLPGKADLDRVF